MANWTEPLPKQTKFRYDECYAKVVLEELYPKEFVNLEIKDKPDLQMEDGKYGVEVTTSIDSDQLNAEGLYTDISYHRVRNETRALEEIEKCRCKLEGGILYGKVGIDSFDLILSAFDKKLKKLNGKGYMYFKRNCLFIFSDIVADDRMVIKAIQDMQQKQADVEKNFHKVFVLVPGDCYCLNLYTGSYEIYPIKFELQSAQANKARELVEEYQK